MAEANSRADAARAEADMTRVEAAAAEEQVPPPPAPLRERPLRRSGQGGWPTAVAPPPPIRPWSPTAAGFLNIFNLAHTFTNTLGQVREMENRRQTPSRWEVTISAGSARLDVWGFPVPTSACGVTAHSARPAPRFGPSLSGAS